MSDFTTPLDALRAKLAGMMANSTVTSGLDFIVAPVDGVAVFDITGAQLAT
jgi:hypothetical protein